MAWTPFSPRGSFVNEETFAHVDPYLAWAEASRFVNFSRGGSTDQLRVLVELKQGKTPGDLAAAIGDEAVSKAYRELDTRYCTATFSAADCLKFAAPGNGLVDRFELAMSVLPQRPPAPVPHCEQEPGVGDAPVASTETLVAMIDHGCPFAHANFIRRGTRSSRLIAIWDQDSRPAFGTGAAPGRKPTGFTNGREVDRAMIDALLRQATVNGLIDEDLCYELARYPELRRSVTHGSHVLDQLIGPLRLGDRIAKDPDTHPSFERRRDLASDRADVVFVQLPRDAWADPSGNSLAACVLDGLRYILRVGERARQIVVNISCAVYTGPHNGSSIFETALAELAGESSKLRVYFPTGNSFHASWHASARLRASAEGFVRLKLPPSCEAPAFVQVWSAADSAPPSVTICAPGPHGGSSGPIHAGQAKSLLKDGKVIAAALHTLSDSRGSATRAHPAKTPQLGRAASTSSMLLLALQPTRTIDVPGSNAPYGDWTIQVEAKSDTEVHVYVARNESELGSPRRGRPSRLVDPAYDPERYMREQDDDEDVTSALPTIQPGSTASAIPVRRRGTISGVATGGGQQAIAGIYLLPRARPTEYSSAGEPDPFASAVCDEGKALRGIRGAGTRSGMVVRLIGTSFACPQRARSDADSAATQVGARGVGGPPPITPLQPTPLPESFARARWGRNQPAYPFEHIVTEDPD